MSLPDFRSKLRDLINCESLEGGSNTPDYILADYLAGCLDVFDRTVSARAKWWGEQVDKAETRNEPA